MNPKAINALSARIARLETMLEEKDAFGAAPTSASEAFSYQGSTFGGVQFGDNYFQNQDQSNLDQQLEENYDFGPTEAAINELMGRIAELELLTAGGSRDTGQEGSLDAGQDIGDDGGDGTGSSSGGDSGPDAFDELEAAASNGQILNKKADTLAFVPTVEIGTTGSGAGSLIVYFAAGKYFQIDSSGNVDFYHSATARVQISTAGKITCTYASSNTVVIDPADISGSSRAFHIREIDVCDSTGTAKKIQLLCTEMY